MINELRKIKRILSGANSKTENDQISKFDCPVCKSSNEIMHPLSMHYFIEMQKYGCVHNIFYTETINFGHYTCSVCGASDRDRLYALFLDDYFKKNNAVKLLDIAPAGSLKTFIKRYAGVAYRSMDLYMDDVDDKLDITDMHLYKDEQFDFFICSHVLEHIPDDKKAMSELYRVLKRGGKGIAMVPINLLSEKTLEDPSCTDIPARWKYFGQDDHIRAYEKKDFINRLKSVGFTVQLLDINYFGEDAFARNAIFPSSVLYIVSK